MDTVSRHFLRRRARARAAALDAADPAANYVVRRLDRGPYRWRVVRIPH